MKQSKHKRETFNIRYIFSNLLHITPLLYNNINDKIADFNNNHKNYNPYHNANNNNKYNNNTVIIQL